jgi:hypothetical protein
MFCSPYSCAMDVEVTVSNYRCFSNTPVRFALKKGLQAFVGVNNSGRVARPFAPFAKAGVVHSSKRDHEQPMVPITHPFAEYAKRVGHPVTNGASG